MTIDSNTTTGESDRTCEELKSMALAWMRLHKPELVEKMQGLIEKTAAENEIWKRITAAL